MILLKRWWPDASEIGRRIEKDLLGRDSGERRTGSSEGEARTGSLDGDTGFIANYNLNPSTRLSSSGFKLTSDSTTADETVFSLRQFVLGAIALARNNDEWQITSIAHRGAHHGFESLNRTKFKPKIESLNSTDIAVTDAERLTESAGLGGYFESPQGRAFLFRPHPDQAIIVIADVAPLWEEDYVTELFRLIHEPYRR